MLYKTVEAAMDAVEGGVEDTLRDNPELKSQEDEVYHDMVQAIMWDCTPSVARELGRRTGVEVVR